MILPRVMRRFLGGAVLLFIALLSVSGGVAEASAKVAENSSHIPTFSIVSVERDVSVTIRTANFPANQTFAVTMGAFGTRGIGGIMVGSMDSGAGGEIEISFMIPAALHGSSRIAIRAQTAHAYPYFAYNWFWNNTTNGGPPPPPPPPQVIPEFTVCSVERDVSATIVTSKLTEGQTFTVMMGPIGTRAANGIAVGTIDAADGQEQRVRFDIPAELRGHYRIAIRLQTAHTKPFHAFRWFYNNTATVC